MSSKSKIIIGIVMLAVGAGMVPTGLLTNDYMRNQVYDGVPEALLGIRAEAVPALMEEIPVLAVPEVLAGVKEQAAAGLEPMLTLRSTPASLLGMKAQIDAEIPGIINFATLAQGIAFAFNVLNASVGTAAALDTFFNNATYVDPFIFLPSIAMIVTNLSYTLLAAQTLLFDGIFDGTFVDPWGLPSNTVPAIFDDIDLGLGASEFYTFMGNAWYWKYVLPYSYPMDSAMAKYNATEGQLLSLAAGGYMDWAFANWVPGAFLANYGFNTTEAAATGFYRQWANGTFTDDGIDLGYFLGTSELKGVEAGVPEPTNISIASSIAMWNASNPLAFTNDDGIQAWAGAMGGNASLRALLMTTFSITPVQLTMLLNWLGNFITNITPVLVLADTGKTINELATLALYEQWANGTIFTEVVLPNGFLGEIDPSLGGAAYFEVGLPTASGLSLAECLDLWDEENTNTFIDGDSYKTIWLPAMQGNTTSQAALISEFGISTSELTALLNWLGAFIGTVPSVGRSAELMELEYAKDIQEIATEFFYEQWANGTIFGEVVIPDGFLSMIDPPIVGPPYFELGLEYSSLITLTGINNWYGAEDGNAIFAELQTQNDLRIYQMIGILTWLPEFRDVIVNKLAKEDLGLLQEPYDLGQTLVLSLGAGGGALAAIGIIVLILSKRGI
jgi:hypothetical protein